MPFKMLVTGYLIGGVLCALALVLLAVWNRDTLPGKSWTRYFAGMLKLTILWPAVVFMGVLFALLAWGQIRESRRYPRPVMLIVDAVYYLVSYGLTLLVMPGELITRMERYFRSRHRSDNS